jgi:L-asparagine oxygenase
VATMMRTSLSLDDAERLRDSFAALPPRSRDIEEFLARLFGACAALPVAAMRQLLTFRASPTAHSALLISGLPIDEDMPATPAEVGASGKRGQISECAILLIAVLLGEPVAYRAEKNGVLVQDVHPASSSRELPSNESSAVGLGTHTELVFSRAAPERPLHVAAPDFVLLLGLRCPEDRLATTTVIEARDICTRLPQQHLRALRTPEFQLRAPHSFTRDTDGSRPWSTPTALLRGPGDAPSLAFDTACGIRALSTGAAEALAALRATCENPAVQTNVQLRTGDLLAIDNRRCAHSRSAFPARFDGRDRWLQRVYVRRNIWPLTSTDPTSFRILT